MNIRFPMTNRKKGKIEIDIKLLERIAEYYEFPLTAFFVPLKVFKGTRRKNLRKKIRKLKETIAKFLEEL
jgi:hypothetical protein